jgi:hypothetical protein
MPLLSAIILFENSQKFTLCEKKVLQSNSYWFFMNLKNYKKRGFAGTSTLLGGSNPSC